MMLPKFLRRLKFNSQHHLIGMIALSVDGFMSIGDDSSEYEKYESYMDYIYSRYVNIMPSYVGISGFDRNLLEQDCLFRFQIGLIPEASYLSGEYTKVYAYSEFRSGLSKFLKKNCPGFLSLPEF